VSHTADLHDRLELYAAGALDTRELIEFDEHLSQCALCLSRTTAMFEVVAALTPDSPPPRNTWRRIVDAIANS